MPELSPGADDPLGAYLVQELVDAAGSPEIDRAALIDFWARLFDDGTGQLDLGLFEDALLAESPDSFDLEAGSWTFDLSSAAATSVLVLATLTGGLILLGVPLAPALLSTVLPIVFNLRRTRITKAQDLVYAELKLRPEARGGASAESLYDQLSPQARRNLSFLDFVDTLEALRRTGRATEDADGSISIRPKPRFRITIS
jgi:hypothetical protein